MDILGSTVALGRALAIVRLLREELEGVGVHLREVADARLTEAEDVVRSVDQRLPDGESSGDTADRAGR